MTIAFTGTRSGMNDRQKKHVSEFLQKHLEEIDTCLHGGCVGADKDFHDLCLEFNLSVEVYPGYSANNPDDLSIKAELTGAYSEHKPNTHFARNRVMVDRADIVIGTPYNDIQKGGTWYTINYAKKKEKELYVFGRE